MTAQTMSFRYELACKGHSTEKAQDLVTYQNDLCCFIGLTFTLYLKLSFFYNYTHTDRRKPIFTALHGMQTQSSDENSACPSVCHTRGL